MAYITTNAPLTASNPATGFFEGLVARIKAWRNFNRTVAELSKLTDRELEDIGITRGSIRYYARKAI